MFSSLFWIQTLRKGQSAFFEFPARLLLFVLVRIRSVLKRASASLRLQGSCLLLMLLFITVYFPNGPGVFVLNIHIYIYLYIYSVGPTYFVTVATSQTWMGGLLAM